MRTAWIRIGIAAAVLVGGFIATVAILDATVYSPAGFVRTYLDALERKDVDAALALAGPLPSSSAHGDFLSADVMPDLETDSVTVDDGDGTLPAGHRMVHVAYTSEAANGVGRITGEADFEIAPAAPVLGVFDGWAFATSPLVQVDLTVLHERQFTANGVPFVSPATDGPATYLAFAPGSLDFAVSTKYTIAPPRIVAIDPGEPTDVELTAGATGALTDLVTARTKAYLDACAAKQQLFPDDCPFGKDLADRIAPGSSPRWTIDGYPDVVVEPTATLGRWQVVAADGTAHLHVLVQSIYDGSIGPLDTDVPFAVGYLATFTGADTIVLTPQD